ncbi:hypothetical protein ID866_12680 [Astraeus odoratus]|nr:hypothetical protein ID866_12680 [Astraeus odoratus]
MFYDTRGILDTDRCPLPQLILLSFVSTYTGVYSGSTLSNYVAGLRAWHLLHGRPWLIDADTLKATIEGVARLAPPSSKCPQHAPFTPDIISLFKSQLNLDSPLDAAIFACTTICFWCIARLGEFTIPSINAFNPAKHITRSCISQVVDRNSFTVWKFHLPQTKTSQNTGHGESVQCACQDGPSNPIAALKNHLCINAVTPDKHLFSWSHPTSKKRCPLSKRELTN